MKKSILLLLSVCTMAMAHAQLSTLFHKKDKTDSTIHHKAPKEKKTVLPKVKKDWSKVDLTKVPSDHFLIQFGSDTWVGRPNPDTIGTKGFSRHFNFYFMLNKPFKTDPRFSVAYGLGVGSSNIFFDHRYVKVWAPGQTLPFDSTTRFKKSKVTTIYLQAPVELRYFSNPGDPQHSWKFAVGAKVGTLLKAYFKGKNLLDINNNSLYGTQYVQKESSKKFFNGIFLAATARAGYGNLSLNVDYSVLGVLKQNTGPVMNTLSIGLTISGL
ncbi:outer membrane beta-barrel protein [Hydrotalea sp.]|uniref:outer membrane beta-barrel protein n=1 Tax=Hydrotalea sp. TaxID=2881279 RepID=UPI002602FF9B|nr:outer membrane beta-barrel protein [Hydrotalea sp.]